MTKLSRVQFLSTFLSLTIWFSYKQHGHWHCTGTVDCGLWGRHAGLQYLALELRFSLILRVFVECFHLSDYISGEIHGAG